jgi:hypothetical protein
VLLPCWHPTRLLRTIATHDYLAFSQPGIDNRFTGNRCDKIILCPSMLIKAIYEPTELCGRLHGGAGHEDDVRFQLYEQVCLLV